MNNAVTTLLSWLNNLVDNIVQHWVQHNIVHACGQLATGCAFLRVYPLKKEGFAMLQKMYNTRRCTFYWVYFNIIIVQELLTKLEELERQNKELKERLSTINEKDSSYTSLETPNKKTKLKGDLKGLKSKKTRTFDFSR